MTDGPAAAPPLPPGREVELPGRGTTFVREVAGPAGRADGRAAARLDGHRRPQLVPVVRRRSAGGSRGRARPSRPRPRHRVVGAVPAGGLRRRRHRADRRARHRAVHPGRLLDGRARSRSWSGSATRTGSTAWCCAPPPSTSPAPATSGSLFASMGALARASRLDARPAARSPLRPLPGPALPAVRRLGDRAGQPARLDGILEAGGPSAASRRAEWVGEIDVPTAVVITMRDHVVPLRRQMRLFERHPGRQGVPRRRRPRRRAWSTPSASCRRWSAPARTSPSRPAWPPPADRGDRPLGRRRKPAAPLMIAVVGVVAGAVGAAGARRRGAGGRTRRTRAGDGAAEPRRRRAASSGIGPASRRARNAELARLGARVGRTYASTAARKVFASAPRAAELDRERELRTAADIAASLGQMKGALMKLGQMASYLDEGLPEPLRLALSQLQAQAPPMSGELAAVDGRAGARRAAREAVRRMGSRRRSPRRRSARSTVRSGGTRSRSRSGPSP